MKKPTWALIGIPRIWSANAESTNARIVAGVAALMTATTSRARLVAGDCAWARDIVRTLATRTTSFVRWRGLIRFSVGDDDASIKRGLPLVFKGCISVLPHAPRRM